jgi:hypothetical protein
MIQLEEYAENVHRTVFCVSILLLVLFVFPITLLILYWAFVLLIVELIKL